MTKNESTKNKEFKGQWQFDWEDIDQLEREHADWLNEKKYWLPKKNLLEMATKSFYNDLLALLKARQSLTYLVTNEEKRMKHYLSFFQKCITMKYSLGTALMDSKK